ncbi:G-protein alpha subunit-domain-containing protein [Hypoxylon trugodes]|uniref:G-protein alpha subunit-domain-containing protein n=1 Tax=Hypoxylon trugodes TaxID=326681 RepID=UPI00219D7323|nr:G-protein alpha subunit-domain-containing protein [Hypoxylon trugodes]KAI1392922.1 G-protein alpha subunit-domain-containing protein [Hypoxylon trugodes]
MFQQDYIPTMEDIRRVPMRTLSDLGSSFEFGNVVYHLIDPGSAQMEQKNWNYAFLGVDTVIFVFDVSAYCISVGDGEMNKMDEQLMLWGKLALAPRSPNERIIVIFTKEDRLTPDRLERWIFSEYFPGFQGDPLDVEDILQNIAGLLTSMMKRVTVIERLPIFWRTSFENEPIEIAMVDLKCSN